MRSFLRNQGGATAVMFALSLIPICIAAGSAIDIARLSQARSQLQAVLDAGMLAAASSDATSQDALKAITIKYMNSNSQSGALSTIDSYAYDSQLDSISASATGTIKTAFLGMIGLETLALRTEAKVLRGVAGTVEVALVLDNTWSMSESDGNGSTKIAALKVAAKNLVNEITKDPKADVRVSLVPYADYVNVGVSNRSKSWLSVPADYTTAKTCTTQTTKQQCTSTQNGPKKTCTRYVDGVPETYDCTQYTSTCTTVTVPAYQQCSGGTNYK